jgi:hypothetical protein
MDSTTVENFKFINTFAPWLSAIGTLCAVIATIYFSRKDKFQKLKVNAGLRLIISSYYPANTELVSIGVTNIGIRKVKLTSIGMQIGIIKKVHLEFIPHRDDLISSNLPIDLNEGDYSSYFFHVNTITDSMKNHPDLKIRNQKIYIRANTSTGKKFKSKIEQDLRNKIIDQLEN